MSGPRLLRGCNSIMVERSCFNRPVTKVVAIICGKEAGAPSPPRPGPGPLPKGSAMDATRIRARTGPEGRSQEGASVKGPLGPGPAPGLFQRSLGPRPKGPDQKANRKRDRFQRSFGPRPGAGPP